MELTAGQIYNRNRGPVALDPILSSLDHLFIAAMTMIMKRVTRWTKSDDRGGIHFSRIDERTDERTEL